MKMKKILITGYKGLIGSQLYFYFNNSNMYDAIGIDRGDNIPNDSFDIIIHCASNCIVRDVIKYPHLAKKNIDYSEIIINKALKDSSFLFAFSSSRVACVENPYTVSKKFIEQKCEAYKNCYGLKYVIIRPETVWGMQEKNKRVMKIWIENILNEKEVIVYGDEYKQLSPISVYDFCDTFISIFNNKESYIHSKISISGDIIKVKDILNSIAEYFDKSIKIKFLSPELTQPQKCIRADIVVQRRIKDQLDQMNFF